MDCPFCKRPMKKGYVPVGKGRLMWLAEGGVPPLTVFGEPENGVCLTEPAVFRAKRAPAFYCAACKWVLVPVPKK